MPRKNRAMRLHVANAARRWSAAKDGWYRSVHHLAMVATKRGGYQERWRRRGYVESPAPDCVVGTAVPRKSSGHAPACSQRRQAVECGEGWSVPGRPPSGDGGYEEVGYEEVGYEEVGYEEVGDDEGGDDEGGDDEGRYEEGRDEVIGYEESS